MVRVNVRKILFPFAVLAALAALSLFVYGCTAEAAALAKLKDQVNVTYGTPITIDLFLAEGADGSDCSIVSDVSVIDINAIGSYNITVRSGDYKTKSLLNIIDDVPPVATPVPQKVYLNNLPDPNDLITDLQDISEVIVDYTEESNVGTPGSTILKVRLTDICGNSSIVEVPVEVIDDHMPPVIEGYGDLIFYVNDIPSFRDGITVKDDYDPNPRLSVDSSKVLMDKVGVYPLTYTAVDEAGNQAEVSVEVNVIAENEDIEKVAAKRKVRYSTRRRRSDYSKATTKDAYAAARKIYKRICSSSMSKVQKGLKIFYWVNHNIGFSRAVKTYKSWAPAVCQTLARRASTCYGQWAVCKALCDLADIPNKMVSRVGGYHKWCLCYLNGGWYHCDATRFSGAPKHYFSYMKTDKEILKAYGYHVFNKKKYPNRCTLSVQSWINVYTGTVRSGMPKPTATPTPKPAKKTDAPPTTTPPSPATATAASKTTSAAMTTSASKTTAPATAAPSSTPPTEKPKPTATAEPTKQPTETPAPSDKPDDGD